MAKSCALPAATVTRMAVATRTSTSVKPPARAEGMVRRECNARASRAPAEIWRLHDARVGKRQCNREPGSPAGFRLHSDAAVVRDDDLLYQRQAETGPARPSRDERPEDPRCNLRVDAGTVIDDRDARDVLRGVDARFDYDVRLHVRLDAGLERVAAQIAERLPQQDLVALHHGSLAVDGDRSPARPGVAADLFPAALRQ